MKFDPESCKIFECITGSNLYGTSVPSSDVDYRGVCIPPLGILLNPLEGFDQKDSGFEENDRVIYNLSKFMKLCANANPNLIELLFIPEKNIIHKTWQWDVVLNNKSFFLSKKSKFTFTGYAFSQLNKIKAHRKYFVDPPKEKPTRKMFGLTDAPVISGDGLSAVANVKFDLLKPEFAEEIRRELEYRKSKQDWDNYVSWRDNRNPARKELEEKYNYDTKAASHLFRLMTEGKELLLTGNITFPLVNANEILAIKNGKYEYEEIISMAEIMDNDFNNWYEQSILPHSADRESLIEMYLEIVCM